MTARQDLIAAAESLTKRGTTLFSPVELIAEARARGSTYSESTLRTHIVSYMCKNAPHRSGPNYGDLERIGSALYRLTKRQTAVTAPADSNRPTAPPPAKRPLPNTPTHEWFWEGNVQSAVVSHLVAEGWMIRRLADTASSEHGVDIEAERNGQRLVVEVKGYPSATYARGERQGTPKTTQSATQARMYFSHALLSGLLMRAEKNASRVALAFPDFATFSNLASRVSEPLSSAGVEVWLVSNNGTVSYPEGTG